MHEDPCSLCDMCFRSDASDELTSETIIKTKMFWIYAHFSYCPHYSIYSATSLPIRKQNACKVQIQIKIITLLNCTPKPTRWRANAAIVCQLVGVMMCNVIISHCVDIPSFNDPYLNVAKWGVELYIRIGCLYVVVCDWQDLWVNCIPQSYSNWWLVSQA